VLLVISPFKVLSVINLIILYTNTSGCLINSITIIKFITDKILNGLITSNTSGCLINSIKYYQVYHRQDLYLLTKPRRHFDLYNIYLCQPLHHGKCHMHGIIALRERKNIIFLMYRLHFWLLSTTANSITYYQVYHRQDLERTDYE
jgi:hypothetical protein